MLKIKPEIGTLYVHDGCGAAHDVTGGGLDCEACEAEIERQAAEAPGPHPYAHLLQED
jgi:hypothetical protein